MVKILILAYNNRFEMNQNIKLRSTIKLWLPRNVLFEIWNDKKTIYSINIIYIYDYIERGN